MAATFSDPPPQSAHLLLGTDQSGSARNPTLELEKKRLRIRDLPILWQHCQAQLNLPWHHRDPFDRLMICQALSEQATLITRDKSIRRYKVKTLW